MGFAKFMAGQMELHLQPVELGLLIGEVRATVEPLARIKAVALNIEPSSELSLIADAAKVRQMLLNLVSNAIKFTPSGGRIDIQMRRVEVWVEIAVRDTGIEDREGRPGPTLQRVRAT